MRVTWKIILRRKSKQTHCGAFSDGRRAGISLIFCNKQTKVANLPQRLITCRIIGPNSSISWPGVICRRNGRLNDGNIPASSIPASSLSECRCWRHALDGQKRVATEIDEREARVNSPTLALFCRAAPIALKLFLSPFARSTRIEKIVFLIQ